jgi:hypothetical protein
MRLSTPPRDGAAWSVVEVPDDVALDVVVAGVVVALSEPGGRTVADEGETGPVRAGSPA